MERSAIQATWSNRGTGTHEASNNEASNACLRFSASVMFNRCQLRSGIEIAGQICEQFEAKPIVR
jgi:hypothetical protein